MRAVSTSIAFVFIFAGCGADFSVQQTSTKISSQEGDLISTGPTSPEAPELGAVGWDNPKKNSRVWSAHVYNLILDKRLTLLRGAKDVDTFCPKFESLTIEQRAYFWTAFVSAFAYYESLWEPTARMVETSMGNDPVTGRQIASEGLLQLSYQDGQNHAYCNEFDWNADRKLASKDPRKTILDPLKNLSCGVQILNRQIERYGKILIDKGAYWAVLKPKRKDRIAGIQKQLTALRFCQ